MAVKLALTTFCVFLVLGWLLGKSGKHWSTARLAVAAAFALVSLSASIAFFMHPSWDTSGIHGNAGVRGAIVLLIINAFIALGPVGNGLVFLAVAGVGARLTQVSWRDLRRGQFVAPDVRRKQADELASLLKSVKEDQAWIAAQPRTYDREQDARVAANGINERNARIEEKTRRMEHLLAHIQSGEAVAGGPHQQPS